MKILAQRPTHISAVATVLLITKTFTVKYYDRGYRQILQRDRLDSRRNDRTKRIGLVTSEIILEEMDH